MPRAALRQTSPSSERAGQSGGQRDDPAPSGSEKRKVAPSVVLFPARFPRGAIRRALVPSFQVNARRGARAQRAREKKAATVGRCCGLTDRPSAPIPSRSRL